MGTSPETTFWAKPSTIAVLPTPGSPIRTGLFFVLLERICITRSISVVLPMTGSNFPSFAILVKFLPNWSRIADPVFDPGLSLPPVDADCCFLLSPAEDINLITVCRTWESSAPNFFKTCAATPSPSRISPKRMCSVPI